MVCLNGHSPTGSKELMEYVVPPFNPRADDRVYIRLNGVEQTAQYQAAPYRVCSESSALLRGLVAILSFTESIKRRGYVALPECAQWSWRPCSTWRSSWGPSRSICDPNRRPTSSKPWWTPSSCSCTCATSNGIPKHCIGAGLVVTRGDRTPSRNYPKIRYGVTYSNRQKYSHLASGELGLCEFSTMRIIHATLLIFFFFQVNIHLNVDLPVLVETTTAFFRKMLSPYCSQGSQTVWSLDVTDNTNYDHRRCFQNCYSLDDLLLVQFCSSEELKICYRHSTRLSNRFCWNLTSNNR